jgi:hypothetical protein
MTYKIQIQYKAISHDRKIGSVPCPHNKGKLCPDISCKMNCDRFISNDGSYLRCGDPGSNNPLPERNHPSLRQVLESYGEYTCGSLAGTQKERC